MAGDIKELCAHGEDKGCNQCRLEALPTPALLAEVEAYESNLRTYGLTPRGWWVELARRLRSGV